MARNKHPEETVKKILEVSYRLFLEKGYEHTTIQDIVNALGMSKGAVYHHFKSKEMIFDRITDQYYDKMDWFQDVSAFPGKNGLEKLRGLLVFLFTDPEKVSLDQLVVSPRLDPKLALLALESSIRSSAPFMETLIAEGNADGSLHVAQPKEMAEAFMLLMNMWVGVFTATRADFFAKLTLLRDFTSALGLPVLEGGPMEAALCYYDKVMANSPETAAP